MKSVQWCHNSVVGYPLKPTKKLLSDSDRLQVLAGCLKYLTSRQLCVDITPEGTFYKRSSFTV